MASDDKPPLQHPQVFINFRGADLRQSFISHLEKAFEKAGVNVYVQAEQPIDGVPLNILFKGLEQSSIALVILSNRYTKSTWCLNELVKINERVEQRKLVAVPIFYKVDPSEVKSLEGDFSLNLWNHVKRTSEFDKLKEWKKALDFVSREPGFVFTEKSNEMMTITNIVDHVKRLDANSNVNPNEGDGAKTEVDFKDESFLGETYSDATSELHNIADENIQVDPVNEEKKQDHVSESSTMVAYDNSSYKMFISFRGGDLHDTFLSFLKRDLNINGVNAYVEEDELRDKDLGYIFKRIEESKIALVIFSTRYAESTWCLDELVKIKERMDKGKLRVIPVFYKMEPLQVTNLEGDFGAKFWNMWRINRSHHIIKWKQALMHVASMEGVSNRYKLKI